MRKLSYFCLIASTLLAGCGKDDVVKPEPEPVVRIENRSYSPEDVYLETTYYSHGSWTEQVEMRPYDRLVVTANENNEGYITFTTDDFDLETVPGISANDKLPRLSFLKFGKEASLPVTFVPNSNKVFKYDENGHVVEEKTSRYSCECKLDTLGMRISLSLRFIDGKVKGTFYQYTYPFDNNIYNSIDWHWVYDNTAVSHNIADIPVRDKGLHYESSPFILSWNSSLYPDNIKEEISAEDFIQTLLNTPFLSESIYGFESSGESLISISMLICRLCSGLYFYDSSSSSFHPEISWYAVSENLWDGSYPFVVAPESFKTNMNVCDIKNSTFRLFIDPQGLFKIRIPKKMSPNSDGIRVPYYYAADTPAMKMLVYNLIKAVSPANVNGILMNYEFFGPVDKRNKATKFRMTFADAELSKSFLKALLLPLLKDDGNYNRLMDAWKMDEATNPYFDDLKYLVDNLEEMLDNTTDIKLGWSYSKGATTEELKSLGMQQYHYLYPNNK